MKKRRIKSNKSDKNNKSIKNNKRNKKKNNINWQIILVIIMIILILLTLAVFKFTGKTIDYEKLVSPDNNSKDNENNNNIPELIKQAENINIVSGKSVVTGNTIKPGKFICSDNDGGKKPEIKGTVSQGGVVKGTDYCTSDTRLKEYYCMTETSTSHYYYNCPYKCLDGKCIEK